MVSGSRDTVHSPLIGQVAGDQGDPAGDGEGGVQEEAALDDALPPAPDRGLHDVLPQVQLGYCHKGTPSTCSASGRAG